MNKANNIRGTNNLIDANTKLFDENKWLRADNERLNNIIEKIRNYVYKPIDKEWDDILCIIEDGLRGSDKE